MDTMVLNIERIRMVLTMFRITQGELARASGVSTAMVSLLLAEKKRPSMRTAIVRTATGGGLTMACMALLESTKGKSSR